MTNTTLTPLSLFLAATTLIIFAGCGSTQIQRPQNALRYFPGYETLSAADRTKADSVLSVALDQEALYTLITRLKPMSSVGHSLRYTLAKDSTQMDGDKHIINPGADSVQNMMSELEQWNRIAGALSFGDIKFVLIPYKQTYKGQRHLELLVCRQSLIDSLITVHRGFFGQWGFAPGVDPHTLITAIEFESRYDRFRAYGYLFGYPEYAVDFFIAADKEHEVTKQFVKRDFFHIPTFARPSGHFTYAIPKGHQPTAIDSAIYRKGVRVLEQYKKARGTSAGKSFAPVEYLREFYSRSAP